MSISSKLSNSWELFLTFLDYLFKVHRIWSDVSSFTSGINNLCLLSFFLISLATVLSVLLIFFEKKQQQLLVILMFSVNSCFQLHWFVLLLLFFSSAYFGFNFLFLHSLGKNLSYYFRYVIFPVYTFTFINFHLITTFSTFHKFWWVVLSFYLVINI